MSIDTKPQTIKDAETALNLVLDQGLKSPANTSWQILVNSFTVATDDARLPISLPLGRLEEEKGSLTVDSIKLKDFLVSCKPWYKIVGVPSRAYETDTVGLYDSALATLPQAAVKQMSYLVAKALIDNANTVTGNPLFSDTQTWNGESTTQDNNLGLALDATNLATAVGTLEAFTDQFGVSLGRKATHLIVPTKLKLKAMELVGNLNAQGGYNVFAGALEVIVLPELDSAATTWYVADLVNGKPLVFAERQAPRVTSQDRTFDLREVQYQVDMVATCAPGLWCNIVKSVG